MVGFIEFNIWSIFWFVQLIDIIGGGMLFEGRTNHPILLTVVSVIWGTIEIAALVLCGMIMYVLTRSWWIAVPSTLGIYIGYLLTGKLIMFCVEKIIRKKKELKNFEEEQSSDNIN